MTTIVTRTTVGSNTGKGSPLTHTEVDTNFVNLNTAKLETAAIPLGTLQAPSVSFLNDSDTGIFCPQGGNSLAIATGGQYAITCSSTQAVGIKTANPNAALHVAGNARVGADDATDAVLEIGAGASGNRTSYIDIVADTTYTDYGLRVIRNNTGANATSELKHRGTGALNITTQEAAPIVFNTTNSPALTILAGGNVGIGTSLPSQRLTTVGNIKIAGAQAGNIASLCLTRTDRSWTINNETDLRFYTGAGDTDSPATMPVVFTGGGSVGIGTTSPGAILHTVNTSAGAATVGAFIQNSSLTAGTEVRLGFAPNTNVVGDNRYSWIGAVNGAGSNDSSLTFATTPGGAGATERMRIDSSGRLLVGTSSARSNFFNGNNAALVQVEGTTLATATTSLVRSSADAFGPVRVFAKSRNASVGGNTIVNSGDECGTLDFQGNDGTEFVSLASIVGVVDGTPGANDMPGRLVFSVTADGASSPSEAVRISNSRNTSFTGAILPSSDNTYQCGASGQRWSLIYAANGTIQTSDARDKTDIASAALGIDFIKKLNPVSYKFVVGNNKESGFDEEGNRIYEAVPGKRTHWGFIAQEVKEAADEFGVDFGGWILTDTEDLDSQQGLRYDQFIAPLTKALQEALAEIDILKAKVASLEAQ